MLMIYQNFEIKFSGYDFWYRLGKEFILSLKWIMNSTTKPKCNQTQTQGIQLKLQNRYSPRMLETKMLVRVVSHNFGRFGHRHLSQSSLKSKNCHQLRFSR